MHAGSAAHRHTEQLEFEQGEETAETTGPPALAAGRVPGGLGIEKAKVRGLGLKIPRVVTGATSGIGKAYAHELAKRGLNVVLISRSMPKLKQVAAEIEEQHGRSTRVVEADFTQGSEIYASIDAALQGLEIGILVNNVGMTYAPRPVNFLDVRDPEKVCLVHKLLMR
nr:very-long-chain 3-oxoacyl-CoA reductase-like [Pelodiscus sinensis]|eukprot:XP_025036710.1 very-long-chain 3-oxoacyl-CoA reductase-like [Pelodiscus sinensis]